MILLEAFGEGMKVHQLALVAIIAQLGGGS